jgi:hypothetical protein
MNTVGLLLFGGAAVYCGGFVVSSAQRLRRHIELRTWSDDLLLCAGILSIFAGCYLATGAL